MGMERRGCIIQPYGLVNQKWEEPVNKAKPFEISKWVVWEAYQRVKANQGAAGVDAESIADFEKELKNNLYKIWNRMSSGSYFPAAGAYGSHTEGRWRPEKVGNPDGVRSDRPDGSQDVPGAGGGTMISSGLLWVPTWEVGDGSSGRNPARGAGAMTGCSIWTSRDSLTTWIMSFSCGRWASTPTVNGCCSTSKGG